MLQSLHCLVSRLSFQSCYAISTKRFGGELEAMTKAWRSPWDDVRYLRVPSRVHKRCRLFRRRHDNFDIFVDEKLSFFL